ncbi:MAG TPA: PAS domain S-box protein [Caldilineae bacterium]|nr:PAS domain S-box protein [Caldilineae bacterium]
MSSIMLYQLRQREYLLEISRAMTSRLELGSVLRLILTYAAEMVGAEVGLIALSEPDGSLVVKASYGIPAHLLPSFAPLLTDIPRLVNLQQRTGWQIPDLHLRLQAVAAAIGMSLDQVISLPLAVDDELLGVIYLFRSGSVAFSHDDRRLLSAFAAQAAIAVRNARLYSELVAEKQRLDAVIENSADGIMILGPDLRIEMINRALLRMTGWSREKALGRPYHEVLALQDTSGKDLHEIEDLERELPRQGTVYVEGELSRKAGSRLVVGVRYTPLWDEAGRLRNIIVNVVDITRYREAEEMKTTFISIISHELKTPVALIKGYATTLAREDAHWDEETLREGLRVIEEESDRLNSLIDNLLDASRIQAGVLKLDLGDVNIPQLVHQVVERFSTQTDRHQFEVDFPDDYPIVLADEERLRQVLNNLISNAIKYSPDGGVIRVGGWADDEWVTVYVADQGIGIPVEEQSRLFQRFYRVDSSLRRKTQGAGLGLYLCKSLIEAHGGRIWFRSEPGKGSTFFFSLPRN